MKIAALLYLLVSVTAFSKDTLSFTCSGGVRFDSTLPLLEDPNLSKEPVLSKDRVCGLPTLFSSSCWSNLIQQGNEYNFSWRCDEAFGDLYFTSENGGYMEFRCTGEGVGSEFSGQAYRNCSVSINR